MTRQSSFNSGNPWWKAWGLRLGLLLITAAVVLLATTSSNEQRATSPSETESEISLPSFESTDDEDAGHAAELGTSNSGKPATPGASTFEPLTDLPQINVSDLPAQAWGTLDLIAQSGPYPFSKDDSVFQNREGILPDHPRGYYREYTVTTPGADNRGARRIVAGEAGELFYTDDHYNSFSEIGFS